MTGLVERPRRAAAGLVVVLVVLALVFAMGGVASGGAQQTDGAHERDLVRHGVAAQDRAQGAERRVAGLERSNRRLRGEIRSERRTSARLRAERHTRRHRRH